MHQLAKIAGAAALLACAGAAWSAPAAAQPDFGIRIGPDRPRIIERRVYRPVPRRTVCRTEWRTTFTRRGRITRPVEVCRTVRRPRW